VQAQTIPDWELFLVDDCSTDTTVQIAEELVASDKRITLLKHSQNHGAPAAARNTGIAAATAEFVTFLDHDDSFYPHKLERMLQAASEQQVDFLCSNIDLVNATTGNVDGKAWGNVSGEVTKGFAKRLLQGNFVPPNSTLIKRHVFGTVGVFDTNLKGVDDFDLWYRIARVFPSGIVNESLATWRYLNTQSISADDRKMITDERLFYEKIVTTERAFPGADPRSIWQQWEKEEAVHGVNRATVRLANRLLLDGNYQAAREEYLKAGATKYAALTKLGSLFRMAYKLKRNLGNSRTFKPLNLMF
jgi:glycosyltransferase involved in cell wall biosynthesis